MVFLKSGKRSDIARKFAVSAAFSFFTGALVGLAGSFFNLHPVVVSMASGMLTGMGVVLLFMRKK